MNDLEAVIRSPLVAVCGWALLTLIALATLAVAERSLDESKRKRELFEEFLEEIRNRKTR